MSTAKKTRNILLPLYGHKINLLGLDNRVINYIHRTMRQIFTSFSAQSWRYYWGRESPPRLFVFTLTPLAHTGMGLMTGPTGMNHEARRPNLGPVTHDKRLERPSQGEQWLSRLKPSQEVLTASRAGGSIFHSVLFLPVPARFHAEKCDSRTPDLRDQQAQY